MLHHIFSSLTKPAESQVHIQNLYTEGVVQVTIIYNPCEVLHNQARCAASAGKSTASSRLGQLKGEMRAPHIDHVNNSPKR